ncbi:PHD transcription factor [Myriangium duriaei CBS 260.36]|uniref:PHD transcription factor n=1 Tax=Myriangium duriaei CBS 260.36 TaxID=1168546 RepID=A0A9P4J6S5_9PEZI|nr:PHD transcription factor [Myriangium duriaei CBS 260.36]
MVVPPSTGGATFAAVNRPATSTPVDHTPNGFSDTKSKPPPKSSQPMAAAVPLSARRADPLDLSTVERRGQPTQVHVPPKRTRLHDIPEAPTYRPTDEEFRDPMDYMRKIAPEGRNHGIIKIIPPDSWNPPFAIDTTRFHFRVRRQELNSVEGGTRANLNYLDQLAKFHRQQGTSLTRFPSVDKRPLDLYKLKKAVESRGGFESVCKLKKWAEIGRDLGYSGKIMSSLSTSLKNSYQKWLSPYEDYLKVAKPGVQHQLEMENGGPFTPSPNPSPTRQALSQKDTPGNDHPAVRASAALHATVNGTPMTNGHVVPKVEEKPQTTAQPTKSSGFTPVNPGGFTAVNHSPSGFTAVNGPGGFRSYPSNGQGTPASQATPTEHQSPPAPAAVPVSHPRIGQPELPNGLKRQISHPDGLSNGDADGRRSKRLKKDDPPIVVGSNMHQPRITHARYPSARDRTNEKPGENCENCGSTNNSGDLLLCDGCECVYHMGCLDPPMSMKPENDWNCPKCLVGTGEFGFEEGEVYSLKQFQERAKRFKDEHFADKLKFDPTTNKPKPITEDDVETEFWRLVENITETVEVEYGADIHSTTHGSGFPTIEKQPRDSYATDPWNLNVLPLYGESLFRHIKSDISGMTVPWLYVGMVFSTFCWHNEDHYAYSANYQHFGATKTWYGIPADDAEKFEQAMREAVPELFETQPDLLFQLVTLLPPEKLRKAGVRVYAIDQRAGEIVITFPQAYHAGFNHGFNLNEAVNFAPTDWEPYGDAGVERLRMYRRQPCFSHDELLLTAAARDTSIRTSRWLGSALERLLQRETAARDTFLSDPAPSQDGLVDDIYRGPRYSLEAETDADNLEEDDYICAFCKCFSFLSRYVCKKSGKVLCLLHAGGYECCTDKETERYSGNSRDHVLYYRTPDAALNDLVSKVIEKGRVPEVWADKVEALLLDEPRPQLKTLRTLLHEGERIPFELARLPDLKHFVDRCNDWVEEATNYITRKQSRRKSDKPGRRSFARQSEIDEQAKQYRNLDNIRKLLIEAEEISFDCPEIETLQERAEGIEKFQIGARDALMDPKKRTLQEYEELAEVGKTFSMDMPEIEQLDKLIERIRWREEALEKRGKPQTKAEVNDLIDRGIELGLPDMDPDMHFYKCFKNEGEAWDQRAKELLKVENVNVHQVEMIVNHGTGLPVDPDTLAEAQGIVKRQREAHDKIISLCDRAVHPDFRKRPKYKEAREVLDTMQELNGKPGRMVDLERAQRRHEDWMRKGKKLFGKTNAPLHILLQHMEIVKARNEACFDIDDKPRMPIEPSSREVTPTGNSGMPGEKQSGGVFCICRKSEAGMMIECEICHEWYHGKCLKLARGKVKEDDRYKCPVCDWRGKIPRDAARPKLEELQAWLDELDQLPFQPDEEQCLLDIINTAQSFRDYIAPYINPITLSPDEVSTMRFYLRKVEGADILLAYETNFLRQELHRMAPVTDEAPKTIEHSGSTRKPRPTKIQKLMAQFGVNNPEDLPEQYRQRPSTKRKIMESLERMEKSRQEQTIKPYGSPFGQPRSQAQNNQTPTQVKPGQGMPGLTYNTDSNSDMSPQYRDAPMFSHSSSFAGRGPSEQGQQSPGISAQSQAGVPNLDPALFGSGASGGIALDSSPMANKELEDKVFADMVQDQDESPAAPDTRDGGASAASAVALATEALKGAIEDGNA